MPEWKENDKKTVVFFKTASGIYRIGKCSCCNIKILKVKGQSNICTECGGKAISCESPYKYRLRHIKPYAEGYKHNSYRGRPIDSHGLLLESRGKF